MCIFVPALTLAQDLETITRQKPFSVNGAVTVAGGYYLASGLPNTRRPYSYSLIAAPTVSLYGIQIPFNVTVTEGSRSIRNPFAQFGINPHWKWIKTYFGWTNMRWTPTTLGGKTFLGAGIEINPSLFRLGAFWGRLNPAVRENLLGTEPIQPQYKRFGWGARLGVGNQKNFVDLIWLRGKDRANSIPPPQDTLNQMQFTPAENAIVGIHSFQTFAKGKLTWQLDGAVSAFTRNTASELLDIGNSRWARFLKVAFPPRLSSSYAWSAHTHFAYKTEKLNLSFDYNRIQPEYQSMGVDFILNDQQKITLAQSFPAGKKKWNLSLSQFYQHDNLNKRKAVRTHRGGISTSANWQRDQKFGITFSYNNFIMFQTRGMRPVNDTTKIAQLQNTFLISPRYTLLNTKTVHVLFAALNYTRLDDFNRFTSQFTRNNTINCNVGYTLSLIKSGFGFAPNFNVLYSITPAFKVLQLTPNATFTKNFWKGKINTSLMLGFTASRQNTLWNARTLNNTLGIGYQITRRHSLKLNHSIMHTWLPAATTRELRGELAYSYVF
ncbi:MAG: hypothetical protein NZM35_04780 [Chitinophagales bacterium]|nr:hypothetical protein [Chitinophagales bacterium]MDW8419796.1 hypothetical protein [Chitinophagales bacterium]